MLDYLAQNVFALLGLIFGSASGISVIALAVFLTKNTRKLKRENKLTRENIEEAFKSAVLPKGIKLDISTKIEKPIKDGFVKVESTIKDILERAEKQNRLMLSILSKFNHANQLTDSERELLADILHDEKSETVEL